MKHSDRRARASLATAALGALLVPVLLGLVASSGRAASSPAQARAGATTSRAPRSDCPPAPADDWGLQRASLSRQALGVERVMDGARTRRPDSSGPVHQQDALGLELPGACALVRTRTRAWRPRRLVRTCVTARAPPAG